MKIRLGSVVIAILALFFLVTGYLTAQPNNYDVQVNAGVAYFRKRADQQLPLVEDLLSALKSGDISRAKLAYVESRPPYEEIEVYAGSFEQEDTDIDARPYAIEGGETSPEFKGFHRIEALIYRDGDLQAAVPYAEELMESVKSLIDKLNDPKNFNAPLNFDGMLSLATEVPAKKISSEEETWSDQSLLIFKHNWIGIHSQFEPYKAVLDKEISEEVQSAYQACLKTIEPFFTSEKVAATPYSSLNAEQRGAIVEASYGYRNALIKAKNALKIPEPES
ncbi:MAG: EfeM/EfeO family lipoprotein [Cyanobacteria bacterium P01_G01_bin.49]